MKEGVVFGYYLSSMGSGDLASEESLLAAAVHDRIGRRGRGGRGRGGEG
jgi:hypothetical protein